MSRLYVEPRKRRRRRQSPSDSSVMLHVLRDGGAAGIEELAGSETRSQMSGSLANISEAHGPSFVTSRATCEMFGQTFLEDIFFRNCN